MSIFPAFLLLQTCISGGVGKHANPIWGIPWSYFHWGQYLPPVCWNCWCVWHGKRRKSTLLWAWVAIIGHRRSVVVCSDRWGVKIWCCRKLMTPVAGWHFELVFFCRTGWLRGGLIAETHPSKFGTCIFWFKFAGLAWLNVLDSWASWDPRGRHFTMVVKQNVWIYVTHSKQRNASERFAVVSVSAHIMICSIWDAE